MTSSEHVAVHALPPPAEARLLGKRLSYAAACALVRRPKQDARSAALRDQLAAKWRDEVHAWPPRRRSAWLNSQEAFVLFGVRRCRELLRDINAFRAFIRDGAISAAWMDAWEDRAERSPSSDMTHQVDRRHSAKMILSAGETSIGSGPRRRRFTPPQAVAEEDLVDLMSPLEAASHPHPGSPSAVAIIRIREMRATPMDGQW